MLEGDFVGLSLRTIAFAPARKVFRESRWTRFQHGSFVSHSIKVMSDYSPLRFISPLPFPPVLFFGASLCKGFFVPPRMNVMNRSIMFTPPPKRRLPLWEPISLTLALLISPIYLFCFTFFFQK